MAAVFWLLFPRLLKFLIRTKAMWWLRISITYRPHKKQMILMLRWFALKYFLKAFLIEKTKICYILNLSLLIPFSLSYTVKILNKTNIYVHVFSLFIAIKLKIWYNG